MVHFSIFPSWGVGGRREEGEDTANEGKREASDPLIILP